MPDPIWTPSARVIESANLTRFARRRSLPEDYGELWQWSVSHLEDFWAAIWDEWVDADTPYEQVLGRRDMPFARWFPGAELNYAKHVFRGRDPSGLAIQHASESRPLSAWTWEQLRRETAWIAGGLRELGVVRGDRVAAFMPNIPETIAAFLATASIGAIWSCAAPEFGAQSVIDRFQQIAPRALITVDGYRYGGKDFDCSEKVRCIRSAIPDAEFVSFGYLSESGWSASMGGDHEDDGAGLVFEPVPFDHPLWILYSSGTTGLPKAIVHSHGGILVEQLKLSHLHLDVRRGDRYFWFTTTGWMMWNWVVGILLTEASIVLYDGSPSPSALWNLAADSRITTFGTSPAFLAVSMRRGLDPTEGRDLSPLRAVGCAGSPLSAEGFEWVYDKLGPDIWLYSASGGTDVCSAFLAGVTTLPVHPGELQARALGAKVESWGEDGLPHVNQVGELVITEPLPSMPTYLWGDESGERLRSSYFSTWPGVWRHGDWIEITDRGSAVIHGRSDSTINRSGVRMGTSEIYRAVSDIGMVEDALVVDVPREGAENWMPLFVVTSNGQELDDDLIAEIRARIRQNCSPRHVPDVVVAVPEIPRTLSGKVLEVPVKRLLMGADPESAASRESLANPAAFDWFVAFAESSRSADR